MKTKLFFMVISMLLLSETAKASFYSSKDSIDHLIKEYKYEKALVLLDLLIQESIPSKDLYFIKGKILKGLFDYNKAIDSYITALSLDSCDNQILIELAITYRQLPDYENSLKYFTLALKNDSNNAILQIETANCKYYLDSFISAITDFKRIYLKDTSNHFVIKRLALCYNNIAQNDSAIYYYNKAIKINPFDVSNVINVCNLLIIQKRYQEGIRISEDYININPLNNKVNSQNAYFHLLNNNYNVSIAKFKKCLQNNDTTKFIFKSLGIAYFRKGEIKNFDTAKYYLEKAYFIDTSDINTLHFLGIACSQSFYKELGFYYLEKAAKQYSPFIVEYSTIYRNLVEVYRTWDKCPCDKKLATMIRAFELNPKDSLLTYYIGYEYDFCKNDNAKAVEYYSKFLNTKPPVNQKENQITNDYEMAEYRLNEIKEEIKLKQN